MKWKYHEVGTSVGMGGWGSSLKKKKKKNVGPYLIKKDKYFEC